MISHNARLVEVWLDSARALMIVFFYVQAGSTRKAELGQKVTGPDSGRIVVQFSAVIAFFKSYQIEIR